LPGIGKIVAHHATRFPATAESLPELHAAFDTFFEAAHEAGAPVRRADRVPIVTAAGEIAANIIEHSCIGLPEAHISVDMTRAPHAVEVVFEDPGIPYVAKEVMALEAIPQGGMGLIVAGASLDELDYAREDGHNRWRLVRNTGPVGPEDGGPPKGALRPVPKGVST
jgi:anti-sigma regulatory factor (Ser/Thr protein kinase)